MANDFSQRVVDDAVRRLGPYRTMVAHELATDGAPDAFSGALLLSLGLRESGLRNINNAAKTDHGAFQINQVAHEAFLREQPGCPVGTWNPSPPHKAIEPDFAPRFAPACSYALAMLKANYRYATHLIADPGMWLSFAIAAYNAGQGGAERGFHAGDIDKYTSGADYSAWVIRHRTKVNHSPYYQRWTA